MQCLSIPIQNPFEFGHPANSGQALLVSNAHRNDDYACALETCASTRILWAFESHERNALHNLGLIKQWNVFEFGHGFSFPWIALRIFRRLYVL
jgi:hypothetical protein